jgi:ribonuclease P protein component
MLAKQFNFKLRSDREFFSNASKTRLHPFTVFLQEVPSSFAITILVPKRVVALATKRNRIKRLLYQELQKHLDALQELHLHCVIVLQSQIPDQKVSIAVDKLKMYLTAVRA